MSYGTAAEGPRVLIAAPFGRDAESLAELLGSQGFDASCIALGEIADATWDKIGVILLTEEALGTGMEALAAALNDQPTWSDVPFILLAGRPNSAPSRPETLRRHLPRTATNVTILERPLGAESLISTVASAMRARQKQFEVRGRIDALARSEAALREESRALETLNTLGKQFASQFDIDALVQSVVDAGVALAGAEIGTFFYNKVDERGESYMLCAIAGVPGEAFADFPMPRNTAVFGPTFAGEGVVRSDDITRDPRYGKNDSHWGMPKGHLKLVSYLAVPVISRTGQVLGGLFFGHPEPGVFDDRAERLILGLAGQASIAIDNARLFQASQQQNHTLEQMVEERTAALQEEMESRAQVEAALRQSQKMEAVGQLTGGIAHDFNNMLAGVIGGLDIVKRRLANGQTADLDRFMEAASKSAQRAAALTARLLAFSRRQSLDSHPVDVNAVLTSFEDLLRRTIGEQVNLQIATNKDKPIAVADANQLENTILNLAINARDAMPDGGQLTISTSIVDLDAAYAEANPGTTAGRYVVIAVVDTGVGMAPELLEKVYEPFFTTKPIGEGTGLGLSMVYGFAQQSGGQVRIHSREGEGTSVKLYLPAAKQLVVQSQPPTTPGPDGDGQSVLLVEDDESVRLLVRSVLEELCYDAIEAPEAQAAIKVLSSDTPIDLMISDVGLPGMNGRQLAEVARQHRPDLPILFVTGYAENAAIRADFLGTNMAMLTKPFALDTLAHKIGEMLAPAGAG